MNMHRRLLPLVGLIAGCMLLPAAQMNPKNELIGTWRLLQYETWSPGGSRRTPFGEQPSGYAVFDDTGHAFIQLMRTPPVNPLPAGVGGATADELRNLYQAYAAYYGTYTVDAETRAVVIAVEGSNLPAYLKTQQVRPFRIDGDKLVLGVPGEYQATLSRVR